MSDSDSDSRLRRGKSGAYPSKGDTIDMVPSKTARLAPEYQNNATEFPNSRRGAFQRGAQKVSPSYTMLES